MKGREALADVQELLNDSGYASYRALTEAHREVCMSGSHSWLREEVVNAGAIKAGSDETILDVGDYQKIESIWVAAANSTQRRWCQIDETSPDTFEDKVPDYRELDGLEPSGRPEFFKIEGNRIRWLPTPLLDYDLKIQIIKDPGEVKPDVDLLVPSAYTSIVPMFAASFVLLLSDNPAQVQRGQTIRIMAEDKLAKLAKNTSVARYRYTDRKLKPLVR